MGSFEGRLFENGGEIVRDLGNNGNLLGVVKKGPLEKKKINIEEGSDLSKKEQRIIERLEIGELKNRKQSLSPNEFIGKSDFGLDETGWKYRSPAFENVLKEVKQGEQEIELERKELKMNGMKNQINESGNGAIKQVKEKDKFEEICLSKKFEGEKLIEDGLVEKNQEQINKRRQVFCKNKRNEIEKFIGKKLVKERKTSAVLNGLEQAQIIFAGNHIYIKFDGLGIYVGKKYYKDSGKKKGGKLSLKTLEDLKVKEDQELKKDGDEVKRRNVELNRGLMKLSILKDKKTNKIWKIKSEYDEGLNEISEAQKKVSKKIGVKSSNFQGIQGKLDSYKKSLKEKWNKEGQQVEEFEPKNLIGEEIDLREDKFAEMKDESEVKGGLLKDKWEAKIKEKIRQINNTRISIEKKIIEKLSMHDSLELLEGKIEKDKDGIKEKILKLKKTGKYENIFKGNTEEVQSKKDEGNSFLKIIAILSEGSEKGKYEEIENFQVRGDLTKFKSIKESADFLKLNEKKEDNGGGIPTGELRHPKNKEEHKEIGKNRGIEKFYKEDKKLDPQGHEMVLDVFVKGKAEMNFGEITFREMINKYNKVNQGEKQRFIERKVDSGQAKGKIAKEYVTKNELVSEMLVPDYNNKLPGQRMKFAKNKQMQTTDPGDVGRRIESEIDEMVSRQIVIKSLDYGRNLTKTEEKELKLEHQRPSRYAYVVKKGSKVDIPEGYCKVATLEDGKNRSGYLPFGWVCVKNSQIMIFDEGKI